MSGASELADGFIAAKQVAAINRRAAEATLRANGDELRAKQCAPTSLLYNRFARNSFANCNPPNRWSENNLPVNTTATIVLLEQLLRLQVQVAAR